MNEANNTNNEVTIHEIFVTFSFKFLRNSILLGANKIFSFVESNASSALIDPDHEFLDLRSFLNVVSI